MFFSLNLPSSPAECLLLSGFTCMRVSFRFWPSIYRNTIAIHILHTKPWNGKKRILAFSRPTKAYLLRSTGRLSFLHAEVSYVL